MQTTKHLFIRGRVQGVGYRAWFEANARKQNFSGWVRNRLDGSVEAIISGQEHIVGAFIGTCWQGPPAARVETVEITDEISPGLHDFQRKETI